MSFAERLSYLFSKHRNNKLTLSERVELMSLIKDQKNEEQVKAYIYDRLSALESADLIPELDSSEDADERLKRLINAINLKPRVAHRVHFLKTAWFRYAAAVILIAGACVYLYTSTNKKSSIVSTKPAPVNTDILPGNNKAILTLSDGRTVELDSAGVEIINDGSLAIENNSGRLMYKGSNLVATNTMRTPKGGQYQLMLSDGTKVWLNAATSITYPTSFNGKLREVTVEGEAYFEVTADASKPFVVKTAGQDITVLGTAFNVNAYKDDEDGKTSLLQGVVKVGDKILKPGEAYIKGKIVETNLEQDIAWKNGAFDFDRVKLKDALRQIARWYDVEVQMKDDVAELELRGQIGRELSLEQVLNGLQDKNVRFKVENRVLTAYK